MKSFLPWMCKCRLMALVIIWTCTSVHAGIPCENNCLQTVNHQADCEVIVCRNGCKPGWYGSQCNKRCSRLCQDKMCNQIDGTCMKGCKGRRLGSDSEIICKGISRKGSRVQRDIAPANMRCLRKSVDNQKTCECCENRYRGPNCSILCENCETFEQPDICKYMCKGGYYGDTCNMTCSEDCATGFSGTHLCETTEDGTVHCSNGCIRGRYGKYCTYSCSQSCKNNTCYKMDGTCVDGCKKGYSGPKCDQKSGNHVKGPLLWWHVVVPIMVLIIIAVVIVIIIVISCKKRGHCCKRRETHTAGDAFEAEHFLSEQVQRNDTEVVHHTGDGEEPPNRGNQEFSVKGIVQKIESLNPDAHAGDKSQKGTPAGGSRHKERNIGPTGDNRIGTVSHPDDKDENKDTDKGEQSQALKDGLNKPEDTKNKFETKNAENDEHSRVLTDDLDNPEYRTRPVSETNTNLESTMERSTSEAECRESDSRPSVKNMNLTESGPSDKTDAKRDEINRDTENDEHSKALTDDLENPEHRKRPVSERIKMFESTMERSTSEAKCRESDSKPSVKNMNLTESGSSYKTDAKRDENRDAENDEHSRVLTDDLNNPEYRTGPVSETRTNLESTMDRSTSEAKCRESDSKPSVKNMNLTESGPSDKTDAKRDENTDTENDEDSKALTGDLENIEHRTSLVSERRKIFE